MVFTVHLLMYYPCIHHNKYKCHFVISFVTSKKDNIANSTKSKIRKREILHIKTCLHHQNDTNKQTNKHHSKLDGADHPYVLIVNFLIVTYTHKITTWGWPGNPRHQKEWCWTEAPAYKSAAKKRLLSFMIQTSSLQITKGTLL